MTTAAHASRRTDPLAWAGDTEPPYWFDIAREYTEKWHHQQQIRDAVGAPAITSHQRLHPVIDTFLRGLPYRYRTVDAPMGTAVTIQVTGEAGGTWTLQKENAAWRLHVGSTPKVNARVQFDQDTAWRLFTKGLTPEKARVRSSIDGEQTLGAHALGMVAVIATRAST